MAVESAGRGCSAVESIAHQPTRRRDESDCSWGEAGQSQGKLVLSVGSSSLAFSPTPALQPSPDNTKTMKKKCFSGMWSK